MNGLTFQSHSQDFLAYQDGRRCWRQKWMKIKCALDICTSEPHTEWSRSCLGRRTLDPITAFLLLWVQWIKSVQTCGLRTSRLILFYVNGMKAFENQCKNVYRNNCLSGQIWLDSTLCFVLYCMKHLPHTGPRLENNVILAKIVIFMWLSYYYFFKV